MGVTVGSSIANKEDIGRNISSSSEGVEGRSITIVTTAALPWTTGTSINPLLRAVELSRAGANVTLMLPFLALEELGQNVLYGGETFETKEAQEQWIWGWLGKHLGEKAEGEEGFGFRLHWYPGRYCPGIGSIIPDSRRGDILDYLPPLSEPEPGADLWTSSPAPADTLPAWFGGGESEHQDPQAQFG